MALTTGRLRNPVTGAGFTRRVGGTRAAIRTEQRRAEREGNTQYANTLGAALADDSIRRASQGESAFGSADSDIEEIIPAGTLEVDRIKRQADQAANMGDDPDAEGANVFPRRGRELDPDLPLRPPKSAFDAASITSQDTGVYIDPTTGRNPFDPDDWKDFGIGGGPPRDETKPKEPGAPPAEGDVAERADAPEAPPAPSAGKGAEEGEEEGEDTPTSATDLGTTPSSTVGGTNYDPTRDPIPGSQGADRPTTPSPATPPVSPTAFAAQEEAFNKRLADSLKSTKEAAAFDQTPEFQERYNLIREDQGPEMAEEFGRRTRRDLVDRFEKAYGRPASMRLIERMREGIGASIKEVEDQYLQESIESGGRLAPTPLGRAEQALETARRASFGVKGQEPPPKWTTAVGKEMVEGIDKIPTDAQSALADLYGAPGKAAEAASIVDMAYDTTPESILSQPDQISARLELALAGESISKNLEVPLLPSSQTPSLRWRTAMRDPSATLGRDPGEARSLEDPLGETPLMTQDIGDSPLLEETRVAGENALRERTIFDVGAGRPGQQSFETTRYRLGGSPEEGATPSPPDWDFAGPERAGPEVTADPIRMEEQQARIAAEAPEARQRVVLTPDEEQEFQEWWATNENVQAWKKDLGNPNKGPDDPRERFDYREAWKAGDVPQINPEDNRYHWGSTGKDVDHPTWHKQFGEARTTEDLTGLPSLPSANIGDSPVPEVRTELEEQKVSYQSLSTDEKVERLATLSKPANATERSALRSVALNADRAVPPEVKADMSTEPLETLEFDPGDGVEFSKEEKDGGKKKRARTPEEREERRKRKLIKNIEHSFAEKAASFLGEVEGTKGKPNKKLGPVFNRLASQGVTGPQSDCPWCAAFVTHAVKEAGGKIPTIIAARDFLKVGGKVSEGSEQEGDIGVMWNDNPDTGGRNGYGGHAIVILSQDENSITGIGGNQDDAVSVMTFPRERFLGVRRIQK